jgi:hypothetical protein
LPEQIAALRRASIVCVLGRAPPGRVSWPRLAGKLIGIRRTSPRGAQRTARGAGCGEHARGSRRPRRCRCGEEFRGLGRRIAAALGRRHSAGWPSRLTCVETWRSSGEAVGETSRTIARHSPGAAAPTARSRAGRGCRQVSMCRMGAIAHGRQLPPLSPPQRVNKGRNLRQVPSERSVARERLNSHSPALRGHLRWRVCRSWSEYA